MPTIANLNGLIIKMYYQQDDHNPPHVHAIYNSFASAIYINSDKPSEGNLPHKYIVIAEDFVASNRATLLEMWHTQIFHKIVSGGSYVS